MGLKKWSVNVGTGVNCLRTGSTCGPFWFMNMGFIRIGA